MRNMYKMRRLKNVVSRVPVEWYQTTTGGAETTTERITIGEPGPGVVDVSLCRCCIVVAFYCDAVLLSSCLCPHAVVVADNTFFSVPIVITIGLYT